MRYKGGRSVSANLLCWNWNNNLGRSEMCDSEDDDDDDDKFVYNPYHRNELQSRVTEVFVVRSMDP